MAKKKEIKGIEGFIDIPFGAFDSETIGWTYTIPEGFSAKIEDGKIIVEKNESDDEEIRKWLIGYMKDEIDGDEFTPEGVKKANKAIAWLEKQKEQKINHKGPHKGSLRHVDNPTKWMEEDDMEREQKQYDIDVLEKHITKDSVSELAHTVIVRNGWEIVEANEHKPAEWSEEDEKMLEWLCHIVHSQRVTKVITLKEESELGKWMEKWLNHNPQPYWKPSEEQMEALRIAYEIGTANESWAMCVLKALYNDLKKL